MKRLSDFSFGRKKKQAGVGCRPCNLREQDCLRQSGSRHAKHLEVHFIGKSSCLTRILSSFIWGNTRFLFDTLQHIKIKWNCNQPYANNDKAYDTLSNSFHLATGTLCIRNKGYTRLHTLNTLRAPKQAVFTWLHQNIERGAVRSCEHIFDGLRRKRFLTVTESIQSMREGNLLPREGKRGGSCGICKKSASEKIANDLKNEMNLTGKKVDA